MEKIFVPPNCCNVGDVLAEDIKIGNGVTIVVQNTIVNPYIKNIFIEHRIPCVWLYQPVELVSRLQKVVEFQEIEKTYKSVVINLKEILNDLAIGYKVDYEKSVDISETMVGSMNEGSHIIKCLTKIKTADEYTYSHCANVAIYAMLIAKWLDLPREIIQEVIQAALLHDIGKVKIPTDILNKKGKLSPDEFEVMKKHSMYGYELIKDIDSISQNIKEAVLLHHERIDGSGYPYGLTGDSIDLLAKIISVADVFDAMTQNRVYKNKVSPFDAFEMFLTIGKTIFDSDIVDIFLKNMAAFYIGANVVLSNGETGQIVYIPPENILEPIINVGSDYIDLSLESSIKILDLL